MNWTVALFSSWKAWTTTSETAKESWVMTARVRAAGGWVWAAGEVPASTGPGVAVPAFSEAEAQAARTSIRIK
jgi:hypothetical protein